LFGSSGQASKPSFWFSPPQDQGVFDSNKIEQKLFWPNATKPAAWKVPPTAETSENEAGKADLPKSPFFSYLSGIKNATREASNKTASASAAGHGGGVASAPAFGVRARDGGSAVMTRSKEEDEESDFTFDKVICFSST
jgi:hypothetical protein